MEKSVLQPRIDTPIFQSVASNKRKSIFLKLLSSTREYLRTFKKSASIVTRLWAGRPGFDKGMGREGSLSLLHRVQTNYVVHAASYQINTRGFLPGGGGGSSRGMKLNTFHLVAKLRMRRAIPSHS
jgi:hypothetical protein